MNAYILTGGNSRRFGKDKSVLEINGLTFVDILHQTLSPEFDSVTIVGKECTHPHLPFLKDRYRVQTPLNGILTALQYSDSDWNFIISVDMPAISKRLVRLLEENIRGESEAVIPVADGRSYPTCAFYHQDAVEIFDTALQQEKYKLMSVVKKLHPVTINADLFRKELINVNTPIEYELLKRVMNRNG
ncbi:MAG: molybdenum cofactor guanylyltransferase [Candidatus Marinimicrobia bacterium]|nr:molybdenum cofactor guanylyltransferase [Candidatus Neomarinimicrobiota bacterium]